MLVLVYGARLPWRLTGNAPIVDEYYLQRWKTSLGLDLIFIALYFGFAYIVWNALDFEHAGQQLAVVLGCTALLTAGFCFYFRRTPVDSGKFFSRWFHTVGYRSVLYDVILLGVIFAVFQGGKILLAKRK
jgi:hypothetical protein